jgi:predicted glutamine amidotransferase
VRASTGTASTRANCHPFAVGERLLMHNVEQEVPDDLFLHRAAQPTVNGERIYAARYATDLEPPTLYTKIRPEGSGVVVVSEPLDKQHVSPALSSE